MVSGPLCALSGFLLPFGLFIVLVDVSDFFVLLRGGEGESEALGGGRDDSLLKMLGGGISQAGGGGVARGREGVAGKVGGVGGAIFVFFRGRNSHHVVNPVGPAQGS